MSINTTLTSVSSSSSSSQVSKSNGTENAKKTNESSFKEEMQKVTEPEKEDVSKTTEKTETTEEKVSQTKENTKTETVDKTEKPDTVVNNKEQTGKQEIADKNNTISKDSELKNLELIKNQQQVEMLKNQQLLDRNNIQAFEENKTQQELIEQNQLLQQQNMLAEKELNLQNINDKKQTAQNAISDVVSQKGKGPSKKEEHNDNEIDALENLTMLQQQNMTVENNYNADTHKTEENELLSGNIIFNNTLTNFDLNNNELSNDIQQMINTSSIKTGAAASVATTTVVGTMSLNSSNKISMTQSDAEFFVNLTQNNNANISIENITAQANEMTKQGADAKAVEKNVQVSQALLDALKESRENNQPVRIDFDQNVSVVLRVNKDGVLGANFIPHDKAVEQYLKNNIEALKTTFNQNDLPYSDLSYSNRGSRQQREQQRNRQQQQQ